VAIPIVYNIRSVKARWTSTIVAVLGIAGTVGVFVAMLSLARGFQATLVSSGSPDNALIVRAGATSEMTSGVSLDSVKIIQDAPGIARGAEGPLVTPEAVLMAPIPLISTGTQANVELRGVSPNVLEIRKQVKIAEGRMFHGGMAEVIVGKNATKTYAGLKIGDTISLGTQRWQVVGVFDAGGSSFDSEVWGDAHLLSQAYGRPDYYAKQSTAMTTLITILGGFVASIMAIGAIFGALNTMYSAVADRGREIATMRALGFGAVAVVFSFLVEALLISFVGGVLGCLAVLRLNGFTTSTINFQTFSNIAFAFKITPGLMVMGVVFALAMGVLGGIFPAIRAARLPVATALREL
jgi:putative ABC transport system permease protein